MAKNRNYILDPSYRLQQEALDKIAETLGVKAYRHDYHAEGNDKNTVLFYIKEEYDKAVEMEKAGCNQLSKEYPRCFWLFENSDLNGNFDLDWENNGKINLASSNWEDKLLFSAELAMHIGLQNIYIAKSGGILEIIEADDVYNDLNRDIIRAFWQLHRAAFIGSVNWYGDDRTAVIEGKKSALSEYKGENVYNFGCDFIIPTEDETLNKMIRRWNTPREQTVANADAISERVERLGGKSFIWF